MQERNDTRNGEADSAEIPQWQIDEVRKRIEKYKDHPELLIDEDAFFKTLEED